MGMHRNLLRNERGFTLPEMMVTTMVMIAVFFALYSIFDMTLTLYSYGNDKTEAVENARLGMEKLERELRAAYPYDMSTGKNYVLLDPSNPTLAAPSLSANQITFGNDLNGNRKLDCPLGGTCEYITYKVSSAAPYTLQRINTATPNTSVGSPVVQFVNGSGGLSFDYRRVNSSGNHVNTNTPSEVTTVRAKLQISKDGRTQTLTTDITLRNKL